MASMHGSYRKVAETAPALELLGETIAALGATECRWLLDRPVSNSGRLKTVMDQIAAARGWRWQVELVHDPDEVLSGASDQSSTEGPPIVVTADSVILDRCRAWLNLAREVVTRSVPEANVVNLG
jgi:hypothetical protein